MKNKKWLSALLVAVMVFTLIPMTAFATTGSGTERDPYVVTTQTELFAAINESTGTTPVYIKIGDNITLSGASLRVQDTQNVVIDGNGIYNGNGILILAIIFGMGDLVVCAQTRPIPHEWLSPLFPLPSTQSNDSDEA